FGRARKDLALHEVFREGLELLFERMGDSHVRAESTWGGCGLLGIACHGCDDRTRARRERGCYFGLQSQRQCGDDLWRGLLFADEPDCDVVRPALGGNWEFG